MASSDNFESSKLLGIFKDPLNWTLLVLALAFGYYILAVPFWQDEYLKRSPQVMSLQ